MFIYNIWYMTYVPKKNFQHHPFHLVSPSPWPLYTSISLFILTTSTVLFMHGFESFDYFVFISVLNVIYSMGLWFRDIISEGTEKIKEIVSYNIKFASAIDTKIIEQIINDINKDKISNDQFKYYLAGLFEGDGHLSLPFLGKTTLNRVLNPRIVFTSHINNIELYVYIQYMLNGKGRFQKVNDNTIRFIIGDIEGIKLFISFIHSKLRTPKNENFNKLIDFINKKYNLSIPFSPLDDSDLSNNSWFTGFTEADGHFGVKIVEAKEKSDTRIRSVSNSISIKFRLDQRYNDNISSMSMLNIMDKLAKFLDCKLSTFKIKTGKVLSLNVSSIDKVGFMINYFHKYPLLGNKSYDFEDWKIIYNIILEKKHLTDEGRSKIKLIQSNMNSKRIYNNKYKI